MLRTSQGNDIICIIFSVGWYASLRILFFKRYTGDTLMTLGRRCGFVDTCSIDRVENGTSWVTGKAPLSHARGHTDEPILAYTSCCAQNKFGMVLELFGAHLGTSIFLR